MYGVYKYECDGQIVYIGKTTTSFSDRFYSHACEEKFKPYLDKAVIYICEAEDAHEADFLETVLIAEHKPILNVAKKRITTARVHVDLAWDLYIPKKKNLINPYRPDEKKTRRIHWLTRAELVERIDACARELNVSRAELLETAMAKYLPADVE